jgi:hypothetical protein
MAAIWQSEHVRALFENQLNVILPRPQLPENHPYERAVRSLEPAHQDYRTPLSHYRPLSSREKQQRQNLIGTLKASGAFQNEYSLSDHKAFILRASGMIGIADILHISMNPRKVICGKVAVDPSDDGKLFFCHDTTCILCTAPSMAELGSDGKRRDRRKKQGGRGKAGYGINPRFGGL